VNGRGGEELGSAVTMRSRSPEHGSSATLVTHSPQWWLVAVGFISSIAAAAAFAWVLQSSGDWNQGLAWERALLTSIPAELPWTLDLIFLTLPWLSSNTVVMPLLVLACLWLWRAHGRPDLALHLFIVDLGTLILTPLLKVLHERPRPDLWAHRGQYAWSAFPSGHAMIGIAVFGTIAILAYRERKLRWPTFALAVLLCISLYSRMYLGVHWPTDVIGGALIGAVWLGFTLAAFKQPSSLNIDERGSGP
jgi:undecaprenyl-diphosphatase